METVEVRLAFSFVCPSCGKETFVNSVMHEFTLEEQSEMAQELGERPQTGHWITHPENVACSGCCKNFVAINPGETADPKKMER
jgi:hypothetical protein